MRWINVYEVYETECGTIKAPVRNASVLHYRQPLNPAHRWAYPEAAKGSG